MSIIYNADEIFLIGVAIEKNGKAFYKAAAEASGDNDTRDFLNGLSEWESGHITLFEKLRSGISEGAMVDLSPEADEQLHLYMRAAADSHVFGSNADPVALARRCSSVKEVLEKAIGFEKDSVVVYASMKNLVPEGLGKTEIDKLINEELEHIMMLRKKLAGLVRV